MNTTAHLLSPELDTRRIVTVGLVLAGLGAAAFLATLAAQHPQRAWQAFLINFLVWSAMAQGAVLFAAVMQVTRARWSGPLPGLAASFSAFFPISLLLFAVVFAGRRHLFPWLHEDLHGKQAWLNIPFLFSRDGIGLVVLYSLGFAFISQDLRLAIGANTGAGRLRACLLGRRGSTADPQSCLARARVLGVLYIMAYALVLSLLGYDLVMSMDPHWVSTLFGAYTFVKAFYIGLGALIILAAAVRLRLGETCGLTDAHFADIGKLFFAFCLLWADFFYVQLVVIWYGNIPEETSYVITRTMTAPWNHLAWTVLFVCFIMPFCILLNRRVKTRPRFMIGLCAVILAGIWLEHLLLLGPALGPGTAGFHIGLPEGLITLGFLGAMAAAVAFFLKRFPELTRAAPPEPEKTST